jgi:hypothetical protein
VAAPRAKSGAKARAFQTLPRLLLVSFPREAPGVRRFIAALNTVAFVGTIFIASARVAEESEKR